MKLATTDLTRVCPVHGRVIEPPTEPCDEDSRPVPMDVAIRGTDAGRNEGSPLSRVAWLYPCGADASDDLRSARVDKRLAKMRDE